MLGAAFSAQADYWDWVGKGAGETSFFDDKGCWFQSGANTDLAKNNHNFSTARNPFTQGWDYSVTFRTTTSLTGAVNERLVSSCPLWSASALRFSTA